MKKWGYEKKWRLGGGEEVEVGEKEWRLGGRLEIVHTSSEEVQVLSDLPLKHAHVFITHCGVTTLYVGRVTLLLKRWGVRTTEPWDGLTF